MSRVVVILTSENCGNKHRDFRRKWPSEAEKEIICYRLNNIDPLHHVNIFVKCEYRNMVFIKDMLGFKFWMMLWWQIRDRAIIRVSTYERTKYIRKNLLLKGVKYQTGIYLCLLFEFLCRARCGTSRQCISEITVNFFGQWLI